MADLKISQLTPAAWAANADLFNIVQGGINKKLTTANLFANIRSSVSFNPGQEDINLTMATPNDANLFYIDPISDNVGISTDTPQEKLDVNGNLNMSGGYIRLSSAQSLTATGSSNLIDLSTATTKILASDATQGQLHLGAEGQIKNIVFMSTSGSFSLSIVSAAGFSNILFDSLGDSVTMQFLDNKWYILGSYGVTIT